MKLNPAQHDVIVGLQGQLAQITAERDQLKQQLAQAQAACAQRCPVCNGNGKVARGFYSQTTGLWGGTSLEPEACRSCAGSGIYPPRGWLSPDEAKSLQKELQDEKKYSEWLAADICKMEDVLGFKNECHDKGGAFVPTIGPWLERVRDLLAAEGELGDLRIGFDSAKSTISRLEKTLSQRAGLEVEHLEELVGERNQLLDEAKRLEADVAAMRDALETGHIVNAFREDRTVAEQIKDNESRRIKALSTTAGRSLLERLERYEVALRWYANEDGPIMVDGGLRAREALKGAK